MRTSVLDTPEDLQWLADVHTRGTLFRFAIIHGNEDCPESIECWNSPDPRYDQAPDAIYHPQSESDGYRLAD